MHISMKHFKKKKKHGYIVKSTWSCTINFHMNNQGVQHIDTPPEEDKMGFIFIKEILKK